MKKFFKTSSLFSVLAIAISLNATPVHAQEDGTFDLNVKHNINGRSLGLDKSLPVDVYANGGYLFTFNFGQTETLPDLPAGDYLIQVYLNGADPDDVNVSPVMTLGPVPIPGGVTVNIRAQLSGGKTPVLRGNIK